MTAALSPAHQCPFGQECPPPVAGAAEPFVDRLLNLADDLSEEARVERLHAKNAVDCAHYAAGLEDAAERIRGVIDEIRRGK